MRPKNEASAGQQARVETAGLSAKTDIPSEGTSIKNRLIVNILLVVIGVKRSHA